MNPSNTCTVHGMRPHVQPMLELFEKAGSNAPLTLLLRLTETALFVEIELTEGSSHMYRYVGCRK